MPDIKIKPAMDEPKVLEKDHVPKDAKSLLKQQYEERKKQREPEQTGSVRYASDRTEGAAKHGTAIAGIGTRRAIKQSKRSRGQRAGWAGDTPVSESEKAVHAVLHTLKITSQSSCASSQQARTRALCINIRWTSGRKLKHRMPQFPYFQYYRILRAHLSRPVR